MGVNVDELSPETLKRLGMTPVKKGKAFTKEDVRKHSLLVLAQVASLTQDQRRQVLTHALKVNCT